MMAFLKKYKWLLIITGILLAGLACWYWLFRKANEVIVLETEKVSSGSIANSVTAIGTLQPVDTVAVGSQVSGTISKVYADFNSPVKKGQLLAQLDKSLMDAQVQQYGATLQAAKVNVMYLKSNYERQLQLYTVGAISKADLETATYGYNSAKQNLISIDAQLKTAKKNLGFTDIYSPIDGTVLGRSVSEGQTVAASLSTPTLFSIAKDLTKMQVQASVDEADIGNVKAGQRVIFSVDAFPADTFAGTIKEIRLRSSISANVVTYITIIDAPNEDMRLKPGMTANITIYTREINNTLIISAAALSFVPDSLIIKKFNLNNLTKQGGKTIRMGSENKPPKPADASNIKIKNAVVWIRKDSLTIISKNITTGMDDKTIVQVVSGLNEGDEVITGYKKTTQQAAAASASKSPFMPTRPRSAKRNQGPPQ